MFCLNPNYKCDVASAYCSLDSIITSNNLATMLLRVIALKLSDVYDNCLLFFGTGTMVATNIESGLHPSTNILLKCVTEV